MKICIDTNVYSELRRGNSKLQSFLESAYEIIVPSIVIGELYGGFYIGSKIEENIKFLNIFLDMQTVSVKSVDSFVAERYGYIYKILRENGTPIPTNDIWIAATAFEVGARLVSYDKHFDKVVGLQVYRP